MITLQRRSVSCEAFFVWVMSKGSSGSTSSSSSSSRWLLLSSPSAEEEGGWKALLSSPSSLGLLLLLPMFTVWWPWPFMVMVAAFASSKPQQRFQMLTAWEMQRAGPQTRINSNQNVNKRKRKIIIRNNNKIIQNKIYYSSK